MARCLACGRVRLTVGACHRCGYDPRPFEDPSRVSAAKRRDELFRLLRLRLASMASRPHLFTFALEDASFEIRRKPDERGHSRVEIHVERDKSPPDAWRWLVTTVRELQGHPQPGAPEYYAWPPPGDE